MACAAAHELDLRNDSVWGRQLTSIRADISNSLQSEIESVPAGPSKPASARRQGYRCRAQIEAAEVDEIAALIDFVRCAAPMPATRHQRGHLTDLFRPAALRRAITESLVQALRGGRHQGPRLPPDAGPEAIRFCEVLFGHDYASLMSRAAENAMTGERKAPRASQAK